MSFDLVIVLAVSAAAIILHVVLFVVFRRWMDRDLALSFAGNDPDKRDYMLAQLHDAKARRIGRRALAAWLEQASARYPH